VGYEKYMKLKGITSAILSCGIIASMAGVVSGTLAWYQYSTRVNASYSGVAVNSVSNLQIGIHSSFPLNPIPAGLTNVSGTNYYFAEDGQGLTAAQIDAYLQQTDFSNHNLCPVTTSSYVRDSNKALTLYDTLRSGEQINSTQVARHKAYVQIPLAFRISLYEADVFTGSFSPWRNVWINSARVELGDESGEATINEGVRVFVDGTLYENGSTQSSATRYIFNPTDESTTGGETVVGGVLDLNRDGFYDTSRPYTGYEKEREILYGSYTGTGITTENIHTLPYREPDPSDPTDKGENYADPDKPDAFADINNTGSTKHSTFTAAHKHDAEHYDDYSGITFGKAQYETLSTIQGNTSSAGLMTNGKPVCTTNGDGIGDFTLTVYLEGWDHSVIDTGLDKPFSMNLGFEIGTK
jgi:hypothetical protein